MSVTLKDLAKASGVSIGTVSRALNDKNEVSEKTSERIRQLAQELGYVPNRAGRALSSQKSINYIGVTLPSINSPFFDDIKKGINNALREFKDLGFDVVLKEQEGWDSQTQIKMIDELEAVGCKSFIVCAFDCDEIIAALPDEDEAAELYLTMCEELESRGFMQYEVSNFAKSGFESRHNCRYWKCQDYIGIGPSAHSCFGGKRFAVPRDIASFINSNIQQTEITDDAPCGFEEYSMLRLRLKEGLSLERVPEHRADIEKKLPSLLKAGYIEYDGNVVSLTRKGFLMSNSVIEYLIF